MACSPPPPPPPWAAFCVVAFWLPAVELAVELLAWLTAPLAAPGLRMATDTALLVGLVCVDVADDCADCVLPAAWPMPWTGTPSAIAVPAAHAGSAAAAQADHTIMVFRMGFVPCRVDEGTSAPRTSGPGRAEARRRS